MCFKTILSLEKTLNHFLLLVVWISDVFSHCEVSEYPETHFLWLHLHILHQLETKQSMKGCFTTRLMKIIPAANAFTPPLFALMVYVCVGVSKRYILLLRGDELSR